MIKTRFLALTSTMLLAFSLAGCSGSSDSGSGDDGTGGGGRDLGAVRSDTGGGGGGGSDTGGNSGDMDDGCGGATACASNADCSATDFCSAGCCAARSTGGSGGGGGGGTEPQGEPCGDLTFQGECVGEVVRWCQDEVAQEIDCATFYPAEAATGTCEEFSTDFGFWCAVQPGDACFFSSGSDTIFAFCTGANPGCIVGAEDASCQEGVGPCTEADNETCLGDIFVLGCQESQPVGFDCAGMGGTCDGACLDLAAGGACGAVGDATFTCAEGLTCNEESGVCE